MKYLKYFESKSRVNCDNCGWAWKIELDDDRKYLCHRCGYDNELLEFDMKALKSWKLENPDVKLPFKEKKVSENISIREFKQETDSGEFVWHRDREDRIVESVNKTDWMIQIDDELPKILEGEIFIKKGTYHRLIKGSNNLKIKVIKK